MKIENQITNLELSKKLKEFGVKQESAFYWRKYNFAKKPHVFYFADTDRKKIDLAILSGKLEFEYSAFSVAELGEMLPEPAKTWRGKYIDEEESTYFCEFHDHEEEADTEANARAKMLIYLIEHKLLDPKKI